MAAINDLRVGLISDTHGLMRPEARAFLVGCDYIVHGGDIGGADILDELAVIAPLIAVRGNNDTGPWAARLPVTELIRVGNVFVYVIHDLAGIHGSSDLLVRVHVLRAVRGHGTARPLP